MNTSWSMKSLFVLVHKSYSVKSDETILCNNSMNFYLSNNEIATDPIGLVRFWGLVIGKIILIKGKLRLRSWLFLLLFKKNLCQVNRSPNIQTYSEENNLVNDIPKFSYDKFI